MKKLSAQLNIDTSIKTVAFDDMKENIKYVFDNDNYNFYLNSELIDVNDRFRIFNYNGKNYIVKKSKIDEGKLEVELAQKAFSILDGLKVDDYKIKIIMPTVYYIDENAYILTEYMGNSLQECIYSKQNEFKIEINTIFDILNLFLSKGVLYRGFLPRNIVVKNNIIYLLDWEDVVFSKIPHNSLNLLWKTNFLLNWSYFYDLNDLESKLKKYDSANCLEPSLLKYEKKIKEFANLNYDTIDLRKFILKTVINSEKRIVDHTNDFIIPPNDMAHLISDLYNSDIDALFDITCSVLRSKSEKKYIELLKTLSKTIVEAYLDNKKLKKNTMKVILCFIDETLITDSNERRKLTFLFDNDKDSFYSNLREILNNIFYDFNGSKLSDESFIRIANYIYSYR